MPPSVGPQHPTPPPSAGAMLSSHQGEDKEEKRRNSVSDYVSPAAALDRFGHYCRAFYSASIATRGGGASSGRSPRTGRADNDGKDGRRVIEALDLICRHADSHNVTNATNDANTDLSSFRREYGAFLSLNASSHSGALLKCRLGSVDDAVAMRNDSCIREEYVRICDAARSTAHTASMTERDAGLRRALEEATSRDARTARSRRKFPESSGPSRGGGKGEGEVVTTRRDVHNIRSKVRSFASKHKSSLGAHPLLAGLRRLLERQLEERRNVVRWTFDGAVITEGCKLRDCGGGGTDVYVTEAVDALTTFLLWTNNGDDDEEEGRPSPPPAGSNSKGSPTILSTSVTFIVDPQLSDRTLRKILEVLPRPRELHARPTGSMEVVLKRSGTGSDDSGESRAYAMRTNADGEMDEKDLCHDVMENVFGRLKLFCPS